MTEAENDMSTETHTELPSDNTEMLLPWRILSQREGCDYLEISDETGLRQMAEVGGKHRAKRAAFIVHAVNSHDALVAALRELNYAIEELSVSANFEMRSAAWGRIEVAQRAARAALSSIGGGK